MEKAADTSFPQAFQQSFSAYRKLESGHYLFQKRKKVALGSPLTPQALSHALPKALSQPHSPHDSLS
jgi:hypothetical protein